MQQVEAALCWIGFSLRRLLWLRSTGSRVRWLRYLRHIGLAVVASKL